MSVGKAGVRGGCMDGAWMGVKSGVGWGWGSVVWDGGVVKVRGREIDV